MLLLIVSTLWESPLHRATTWCCVRKLVGPNLSRCVLQRWQVNLSRLYMKNFSFRRIVLQCGQVTYPCTSTFACLNCLYSFLKPFSFLPHRMHLNHASPHFFLFISCMIVDLALYSSFSRGNRESDITSVLFLYRGDVSEETSSRR